MGNSEGWKSWKANLLPVHRRNSTSTQFWYGVFKVTNLYNMKFNSRWWIVTDWIQVWLHLLTFGWFIWFCMVNVGQVYANSHALRIIGPSKTEGFGCVFRRVFLDLQTTSFGIRWFLGWILSMSFGEHFCSWSLTLDLRLFDAWKKWPKSSLPNGGGLFHGDDLPWSNL